VPGIFFRIILLKKNALLCYGNETRLLRKMVYGV
jgi:hypothetical protein